MRPTDAAGHAGTGLAQDSGNAMARKTVDRALAPRFRFVKVRERMFLKTISAKYAGPGAIVALASFFVAGCLGGGASLTNLPDSEVATVNLTVRLGKVDAMAPASGDVDVLTKASADDDHSTISLKSMTLRFSSNLNDTLYDTITAAFGVGVGSGETGGRVVVANAELPPLRWWNIEIKTFDTNDSIIHYGNVGPIASKGGQVVDLNVPVINSRFSVYEARYALPSEIFPANVPDSQRVYQKIFFSRLLLEIDGQVVRDSSSFSPSIPGVGTRFITAGAALRGAEDALFFKPNLAFPDTVTHIQAYKYVRTGPRVFKVSAFGYLEGDSVRPGGERLLYSGERNISITPGASLSELPVVLAYRGPGSASAASDTTSPSTPGSPNWTGVSMEIQIGKTGVMVQPVEIPGGVDLL